MESRVLTRALFLIGTAAPIVAVPQLTQGAQFEMRVRVTGSQHECPPNTTVITRFLCQTKNVDVVSEKNWQQGLDSTGFNGQPIAVPGGRTSLDDITQFNALAEAETSSVSVLLKASFQGNIREYPYDEIFPSVRADGVLKANHQISIPRSRLWAVVSSPGVEVNLTHSGQEISKGALPVTINGNGFVLSAAGGSDLRLSAAVSTAVTSRGYPRNSARMMVLAFELSEQGCEWVKTRAQSALQEMNLDLSAVCRAQHTGDRTVSVWEEILTEVLDGFTDGMAKMESAFNQVPAKRRGYLAKALYCRTVFLAKSTEYEQECLNQFGSR